MTTSRDGPVKSTEKYRNKSAMKTQEDQPTTENCGKERQEDYILLHSQAADVESLLVQKQG